MVDKLPDELPKIVQVGPGSGVVFELRLPGFVVVDAYGRLDPRRLSPIDEVRYAYPLAIIWTPAHEMMARFQDDIDVGETRSLRVPDQGNDTIDVLTIAEGVEMGIT